MKVVILAGGFGTRISEESHLIPKPMITIGDKPILWHIMKHYSYYGFNDFIICAGYKQYVIKEFFSNYFLHTNDVTFDFKENNKMLIHQNNTEPWKVTIVDTGLNTMTGGRIKRISKYISDENFLITYGDGLSDVNLTQLISEHIKSGKLGTITAVKPEGRFGHLNIDDSSLIKSFKEKSNDDTGWINGGFMILSRNVFDLISDDKTNLEADVLEELGAKNQLNAFKHHGFWHCMDSMKDKINLEKILESNIAPWKTW